MLQAEENRLAQLQCAELRSLGRSLINKIQKQIDAIEGRISGLIAQDQTLCAKAQKLTAVTGVGARTAALLLAQMPELSSDPSIFLNFSSFLKRSRYGLTRMQCQKFRSELGHLREQERCGTCTDSRNGGELLRSSTKSLVLCN